MLDFDNFPIDALPPILRNAVLDAHYLTLAPVPLIVSSALGASSVAFQKCFDVQRPNGLVSPLSLFTLVVAESGERKSTVDGLFTQPILEHERLQSSDFELQQETYQVKLRAWQLNGKHLQRQFKFKKARGTEPEILEHVRSKPKPPERERILFDDTTAEALKFGLRKPSSSIGVFSAEASSILDGHGFRDLAFLNDAWSGTGQRIDRRSSDCFIIENPRITISMMCQPEVFMRFVKRHGAQARGIGLFARFLFAFPTSTQGFRTLANSYQTNGSGMNKFHDRLREVLAIGDNATDPKTILTFAPNAAIAWQNFYSLIEANSAPGCQYHAIRDYASKLAENVARIAAIFHVVQFDDNEISWNTVEAAIAVAMFFLNEFCRMFGQIYIPQDVLDANLIKAWLDRYSMKRPGIIYVEKKVLTQCVTPCLRSDKQRRERAIAVLAYQGVLREVLNGRKRFIELNPAHFPATIVQQASIQAVR